MSGHDGQGLSPETNQEDGQNVSSRAVRSLVEQQQYRCALTGVTLTPDDAALDHAIPVSRGGQHVMGNMQVLHRTVNTAKGTMTTEEFVAMCQQVAAWAAKAKSGSFCQD
ncbi:HNH endonuclease [bacterium]|nr:HNH endonuclease [bacterium]